MDAERLGVRAHGGPWARAIESDRGRWHRLLHPRACHDIPLRLAPMLRVGAWTRRSAPDPVGPVSCARPCRPRGHHRGRMAPCRVGARTRRWPRGLASGAGAERPGPTEDRGHERRKSLDPIDIEERSTACSQAFRKWPPGGHFLPAKPFYLLGSLRSSCPFWGHQNGHRSRCETRTVGRMAYSGQRAKAACRQAGNSPVSSKTTPHYCPASNKTGAPLRARLLGVDEKNRPTRLRSRSCLSSDNRSPSR